MEHDKIRNSPEYGILENYADESIKYDNLDDFRRSHIYEIALNNPEVWSVAKKDFELYANW